MTMRYLLDTNIVSDLVRNPQGKIAQRIRKVGEVANFDQYHRRRRIALRSREKSIHTSSSPGGSCARSDRDPAFQGPADAAYGSLRARLASQADRPIGANDLLIAAQALALGHILVSDNEREFARIEDLRLENWLR